MLKNLLRKFGAGSLVVVGLVAILFQRGFGARSADTLMGLMVPDTARADYVYVQTPTPGIASCDQSNDCSDSGSADASCL